MGRPDGRYPRVSAAIGSASLALSVRHTKMATTESGHFTGDFHVQEVLRKRIAAVVVNERASHYLWSTVFGAKSKQLRGD